MLHRPLESNDDGRMAGYFLRELRPLIHTLDYHAEPLYIGRKTPLCGKSYKSYQNPNSIEFQNHFSI
jgi:hypothetical protein